MAFPIAKNRAGGSGVSESGSDRIRAGLSSFYRTRRRVYGLLLLFVIAVGVAAGTVPKLRSRLLTRAQTLWDAATGKHEPMMVQVGQNQEPLPPEFELPSPPVMQMPRLPAPAKVLTTPDGGYRPGTGGSRASSKTEEGEPGSLPSEEAEEELTADTEPEYQQGKVEQEAYDLLLNSNSAVAEIAKGNNPSLKFKSWDAAARGDGIYWVRLKLEAEGKPVADYIWQVKLGSKQVSPLNYNARSIS